MEGALGERLKREYNLFPDKNITLAGHVYDPHGQIALKNLWGGYLSIAEKYNRPFLATTPTRRVNKERVSASKYDATIIDDNVSFLQTIRDSANHEMYLGALIGCKGDAFKATDALSEVESTQFHSWEIERFAQNDVDFFFAGIMPALPEAAGMAIALSSTQIPYIISLMIRDNGRLIDGTTIHDAISYIDGITDRQPICYMTNCVHPDILYKALSCECNKTNTVSSRFAGIQANASPLTPEELDGSKELHLTEPHALASRMNRLKDFITLKIVGGCCGTDDAHMNEMAKNL